MSISTAILVSTLSYSWRIMTRYTVSKLNIDLAFWSNYPVSAFTITMFEFEKTIPTLWHHVKGLYYSCLLFSMHAADLRLEFADHHPQYIADGNSMGFLSDDAGNKYNLCHCKFLIFTGHCLWLAVLVWSNFEIADMDFWRGPAYTDFFNYLDGTGGFYYEVGAMLEYRTARWVDASSALGWRTRT